MSIKVLVSPKPSLKTLTREVGLLRSLIIAVVGNNQDVEGEYRPEFVEEMLRVSATARPAKEFTGAKSFLRRFQNK